MAYYEVFYWLPGIDYEYYGMLAKQETAKAAEDVVRLAAPGHTRHKAVKLEPKTHEEMQAILERYYRRNKPVTYEVKE